MLDSTNSDFKPKKRPKGPFQRESYARNLGIELWITIYEQIRNS